MNKLRKHGVYYDSRIKLLLILLTSALAFALGGGLTGLLLFGVVCLFALLSGLWKTSIKVAIVYIVLLMLAQVLPIHLSSVITFFLLRILTIALALNILFQTTEISELIAALQASHIPQAIPLGAALMQGKRYALFSRFSVHTARVTHLIKIFTFYREYAILCTKETRKS